MSKEKYDKMSNEEIEDLVASMRIGNKQHILFKKSAKGYCFKEGIVYLMYWREADLWVHRGYATYEFGDDDDDDEMVDYEIVEMKYDWDEAVQKMQNEFYGEDDESFDKEEEAEALAAYEHLIGDEVIEEDDYDVCCHPIRWINDEDSDEDFEDEDNTEDYNKSFVIKEEDKAEPEQIKIRKEKKMKRTFICKTCGEDCGSGRGLGSHYQSNPDHRPYKNGWKNKVMNTSTNTENLIEK